MSESTRITSTEPSSGEPMIGVLPFSYRGTGEDAAFFASGVHDDLLTQLSQLSGLRVVSRTSVLAYAGTTKNVIEIGRELGADAILEGGVQLAGEQIRINAQLIDARTDAHLWAQTYDRKLTPKTSLVCRVILPGPSPPPWKRP
jgi:TolB-like protein